MRVRFWGTRGSIAKPGPSTVRHGGNTSCVEVRTDSGTLLVLDCGTGAHALGRALLAEGPSGRRGHMLITHTHWDHIQGFPFFAPLFVPGNEWDVYAPRGQHGTLRDTLSGQMQYRYFPVSLDQLGAAVRFHDLVEGTIRIEDVTVTTRFLNHPALTLGYRIQADGATLAFVTDHEPHDRTLAASPGDGKLWVGEDANHRRFVAGADLLIHDSQYLAAEYPQRVGWGHSTIEYVTELARSGDVNHLVLYHHDPYRDDDSLDRIVAELGPRIPSALTLTAASEGHEILVVPGPHSPSLESTPDGTRVCRTTVNEPVLVAVKDPAAAGILTRALLADEKAVHCASDVQEVLDIWSRVQPVLTLVEWNLPGGGIAAIRRGLEAAPGAADVPLVAVLTGTDPPPPRSDVGALDVQDWLETPFSPQYARTRIRAWILREVCRWEAAPRPDDETSRLQALDELGILDTPAEARFDRITRLARLVFGAGAALVTFVDRDRQWFKSQQGTTITETARDLSFCAHTILRDESLVIPDTLADHRFRDNPMVTGDPRVRFYAGAPVRSPDCRKVGTICVLDTRPCSPTSEQIEALEDLARLVEQELVWRIGLQAGAR